MPEKSFMNPSSTYVVTVFMLGKNPNNAQWKKKEEKLKMIPKEKNTNLIGFSKLKTPTTE